MATEFPEDLMAGSLVCLIPFYLAAGAVRLSKVALNACFMYKQS